MFLIYLELIVILNASQFNEQTEHSLKYVLLSWLCLVFQNIL